MTLLVDRLSADVQKPWDTGGHVPNQVFVLFHGQGQWHKNTPYATTHTSSAGRAPDNQEGLETGRRPHKAPGRQIEGGGKETRRGGEKKKRRGRKTTKRRGGEKEKGRTEEER